MSPRAAGPRPTTLTWNQATRWRLRRHRLHPRAGEDQAVPDIVSDICGLHAQVMSSAELTLWARTAAVRPDALRAALWDERTLLKTWAMRGTLHLLRAEEAPSWLATQEARMRSQPASWYRGFGVTPDSLERLIAAVAEALDDRVLTRSELGDEVARLTRSRALGDKLRESWGALLKPAAFRGLLCFAPSTGQQVRFTRPDRWLRGWEHVAPEHAGPWAARRFLAVNAPATREDFARWLGARPARAGALIEALGDEARPVEVDGTRAWMLAADVKDAAGAAPSRAVRLLPAFDQYVVAATAHAERLMPAPSFKARVYRSQGWLSPVVLVDGRMAGTWRHKVKGSRLHVELEPFAPIPRWVQKGAEVEAERLADHLGRPLELQR